MKGKELKYNIEKYFFGKTRREPFGFWVSRDGVKSINRNIEAITNMKPPNSRKQVQQFIYVVH